jgi:serine/threonine protein phosphatase PrpC
MTDASDTTAAPKEPETTASPAATGEAEPSSGPSAAADAAAPSIEISNESSAAPAPATAVETAPVGTPVVSSGPVEVRLFGRTDVGMIREHNEDNFLIADLTQRLRNVKPEIRTHTVGSGGTLFAVCDGMGGAAAGEVASQMAVDVVHYDRARQRDPGRRDQFAQKLVAIVQEAGARIYLAAKTNRAQHGMGTTSTVAGVYGTRRCSSVRWATRAPTSSARGKLQTDHQGPVAGLEAHRGRSAHRGRGRELRARAHHPAGARHLGRGVVDLSFIDLRKGDVLMLCSDGLCGLGGHDNITVIVVRFGGGLPKLEPGDEVFGYQPWILSDEPHNDGDAKVASRIKGADAPPPGKDVKNAVSIRPPAPAAPDAVAPAGRDKRPAQRAGDDEEITLPVSNGPRYALVAFLLALAVGLLLAALYLIK